MKIVLDTNVFISGIFFGGPPGTILEAWQDGQLELVVSLEILTEYKRVEVELAEKYSEIDPGPLLALLALSADIVECPPLDAQVCADPDDDKFLACAIASGAKHVVSGDKALISASGYGGVEVIRPRDFFNRYLNMDD